MDSKEQDEVDEIYELPSYFFNSDDDEVPEFCDEVDEIFELPSYFFNSDDEVPEFCELNQSKEETNNGIDLISELPDFVLCKILSLMPTRYAMAAKILSTRWKTLFPFFWIPPIVIDLDRLPVPPVSAVTRRGNQTRNKNKNKTKTKTINTNDSRICYEKFVDELLLGTLINVPCLDAVNFKCPYWIRDQKILSWVTAALQLNVRELFFGVCPSHPEDLFHVLNGYAGLEKLEVLRGSVLGFEFPKDFTLPNLTTLVLTDLSFDFEFGCSLPNLRTLLLTKVDIDSSQVNSLSKLITLEVLSFKRCDMHRSYDSTSFCSIQCPSLKNLTIEDCNGIQDYYLTINTPKLQVLFCKGFAAGNYTVSNPLHSLLSAHIDVEFSYSADGVEEFVAACSNVVDLFLCAFAMNALRTTCAQLPMFNNLNRLALGHIQLDGWVMLARLLWNSPNLEKLVFKQGFCLHDEGYSSFESLMTTCPPCLELHVKKIVFLDFDEKEDEIKLVEYFMKSGKVIEMLELHCLPFKYESTRERLSVFPRQLNLVFRS